MAFTLKIETDNAAFDDDQGWEIAVMLHKLAEHLTNSGYGQDGDNGTLRDVNGNTVGIWTLDEREDTDG